MIKRLLLSTGLISLLLFSGCSKDEEELPAQDEFRVLKSRLNEVQTALIAHDSTALNELLVPSLQDDPEGVDSLINFVYGDQLELELRGLTNYQIYHTLEKARIDCEIASNGVDSLRAATLTFELIDTLWLLKRWETGLKTLSKEAETDTN